MLTDYPQDSRDQPRRDAWDEPPRYDEPPRRDDDRYYREEPPRNFRPRYGGRGRARGGFGGGNRQFRRRYDPLAVENCEMLRDKFIDFYKKSATMTPEEAWKAIEPQIQDAFQVTLRTLMYKFVSNFVLEKKEVEPKTSPKKEIKKVKEKKPEKVEEDQPDPEETSPKKVTKKTKSKK